jgi:hypothetical protein
LTPKVIISLFEEGGVPEGIYQFLRAVASTIGII